LARKLLYRITISSVCESRRNFSPGAQISQRWAGMYTGFFSGSIFEFESYLLQKTCSAIEMREGRLGKDEKTIYSFGIHFLD
jgi:uncharacterized protein YcsI (UPF0317 family)